MLISEQKKKVKKCVLWIVPNTGSKSYRNCENKKIEEGKMERLTPVRVQDMLRKKGRFVTLEEAEAILTLLRKLANIAVSNYLNNTTNENS